MKVSKQSSASFKSSQTQKDEITFAAQKIKFTIKDFFSKCDQIHRKLRVWPHLLKKSLMENFVLCAKIAKHEAKACKEIQVFLKRNTFLFTLFKNKATHKAKERIKHFFFLKKVRRWGSGFEEDSKHYKKSLLLLLLSSTLVSVYNFPYIWTSSLSISSKETVWLDWHLWWLYYEKPFLQRNLYCISKHNISFHKTSNFTAIVPFSSELLLRETF